MLLLLLLLFAFFIFFFFLFSFFPTQRPPKPQKQARQNTGWRHQLRCRMALIEEAPFPFASSLEFADHLRGIVDLSPPSPASDPVVSPLSTTLLSNGLQKSVVSLPSDGSSPHPKKGDLCLIDFLKGDLPLPFPSPPPSPSLSPSSPSSPSSSPSQFPSPKKQIFEFILGEGTAHPLLEQLVPTMKVGETASLSPSPSPTPSSFYLQATLVSIKPQPKGTFTSNYTQAQRHKEEANVSFRSKDYLDAHSRYIDSISLSLSIPPLSLSPSPGEFVSYFNLVVALLLNKVFPFSQILPITFLFSLSLPLFSLLLSFTLFYSLLTLLDSYSPHKKSQKPHKKSLFSNTFSLGFM